jgi:hypothetical protein
MISLQLVTEKINYLADIYALRNRFPLVGKTSVNELARTWYKELKDRDLKSFESVIEKLATENYSNLPGIAEVKKRVAAHSSLITQELTELKHFVCQHKSYFSNRGLGQTKKELWLCEQKSEQEMLNKIKDLGLRWQKTEFENFQDRSEFSKRWYGVVLCYWHQRLLVAKTKPDSGQAIECKIWVESFAKNID